MNDFVFVFGLGVLFVPANILWASMNVPFELAVITTIIGIGLGYGTKEYFKQL